jgi:DNA processing protein
MARIALTWLAEPGNRAAHELVRQAGATAALRHVVEGDAPDPQLRAAALTRMAAGDPYRLAEVALRRAERLGARVVVPGDDEWPRGVQDLARMPPVGTGRTVDRETSPPLCLWVRGPLPVADAVERSVAVVGARAATSYGVHVATDIAYGLAERDWTIVSGGAYGIDAAAHRAAFTAGGTTVAVLACGVDRPYPMGNAALFDRIAEDGLLISEWPPGAEPLRHRFLIRNRVIAAVTAGTVVVEAAARSGARQTLHRALKLGRRAMVVPGPVTSALSVGCHELLRDNPETRLVTGLPHVLEEVGRIGTDLAPVPRGPEHPRDALDDESARLLEVVPLRGTASPDQLSARSGLELRAVLRRLAGLEHLGLIRRRDGGFCLSSTPRQRTRTAGEDGSPPTAAIAEPATGPGST